MISLFSRNADRNRLHEVSPFAGVITGTAFRQKPYTLRNRVSWSRYIEGMLGGYNIQNGDTAYYPNYNWFITGIDYSYDIHGNVDSMLNIGWQGSILASFGANMFKTIAYQYDLISGKVNQVHYQPGYADEFYHRYEYDADNRLTDVYTSELKAFIGQEDLEEHDAHYEYYKHGPLSRAVLGHQQVQGVDYVYTLQGWLKGVNSTVLSPTQDMGGDGKAGSGNAAVGRDAYGFNLNYFTGDYGAIQTGANPFPGHTAYIGSAYKPLYNGNISSMAVNIGKLNQPQLYNYGYDQLNRIVSMDVYRGLNQDSNSWAGVDTVHDYRE